MYYENGEGKSLDEMVMEKERQLRREEARKRAQEEMKKREDAHRLQRLNELERVSSTNFDNRGDEENVFYARPNVSGIIRAAKAPKLATIGEYNDAIKAQDEMIDIMHKHRWENASVHTKEEAADAKKLYDTAKEYKANLEIAKAEAYGLGQNGYWKKNSKTYGQGMNHAYGNVGEGIKAEQERKAIAANQAYYKSFGSNKPTTEYTKYIVPAKEKPTTEYTDYIVPAVAKPKESREEIPKVVIPQSSTERLKSKVEDTHVS